MVGAAGLSSAQSIPYCLGLVQNGLKSQREEGPVTQCPPSGAVSSFCSQGSAQFTGVRQAWHWAGSHTSLAQRFSTVVTCPSSAPGRNLKRMWWRKPGL